MVDIHCYGYVEDQPTAEVAKKLFDFRNERHTHKLLFREGFPAITKGNSALKRMAPSFINMAQGGLHTFAITDLDNGECAVSLIRDWFSITSGKDILLPKEVIFRVAVREIESWILADRKEWADFIGIAEANFSRTPDDLPDPKQFLLNAIRNKGKKKYHNEMLPKGTAHIGPRYNEILCNFIKDRWSPIRASNLSPSLKRTIDALNKVIG